MKYKNEMVNRESGEIRPVHVMVKRRVDWAFVQLRQESSLLLSLNDRMTFGSFKVLHWLMGSVNHECSVKATQTQIGVGTGLSRQAVNRAIKVLVEEKFVILTADGFSLNKDFVRRGAK